MIAEDLNVFFDTAGFASTHTINGVSGIVCIVGDKVTGRSTIDGEWVSMFNVMVKKADLSTPPEKRKRMVFDGTTYHVENVKDDGAVYTITLSSNHEGNLLNQI